MEEIIRYDAALKELHGSIISKARKLNRLKRIVLVGWSADRNVINYDILPIIGYNKTQYRVEKRFGEYSCNCQQNAIKKNICSHIVGVKIYEKQHGQTTDKY